MSSKILCQYSTWCNDLDRLDPNDYFKYYDFWEEFDETKEYQNDIEKEYQGKNKKYRNVLYTIRQRENFDQLNEKKRKFVISEEQYDVDEINSLIKFCPCKFCQMYWFNPIRFLTCPCCVGCISSANIWTKNVKQARLAKQLASI
jgi:hypothetical protein